MRVFANRDEVVAAKGEKLGTSDWLTITQEQVNQFADATLDHQWIHLDAERAAQGPFGGTIAHGFLTLSLLPALNAQTYRFEGVKMGINYGLNKVRFPHPVPVGARVRSHTELADVAENDQGLQLTVNVTIEIEGVDKPACVAESLSRLVF
ncbi:acyl dehydratase [Saccharopolyspora erythraea NRRL 2338]|uniref:MaoC-like dehydratase n=2 Tax=Saccharopolyspora erythraea TaxID=1836 RepID=A4FKP7_SACEN|nr:MaoC family dehydratase [Saccharopolyspora erythraea]EQD84504.1 MaoC family dehydratase [Saccharopolyspora erythraea D]PFG98260.1 acyl dehydratase [Saccharopolyspora erythraea NRRL 2338]QRK88355.1 MaoC family dehydratase [Saccharopolyspora erythraea]CAM04622.1 MaoC-like dehydratase [Saccharopolyspora erythraea NRRL 2338]